MENCKIEWIGNFPCNSKKELEREEGQHQRENQCVNKLIAGRTNEEWIEDNKERLKQYKKDYKKHNQEYFKEINKQHYQDNREHYIQMSRENYEKNKDEILEKMKETTECPCGSIVRKHEIRRHERSKKHQNWLKEQEHEQEQ